MIRATSLDELEPLLALCRTGKLFDVVEWVKAGKPVALPENAGAKGAHRNPLRVAMDRGFHSLVQVLLEAGAPYRVGGYNALENAVDLRRPDLAALLVQHGARVSDVSMRRVIEEWDTEVVDLFLTNGANLQEGMPVAWGLIGKIRPALGLLKRFGATNPDIMKQAACALRHHANEGNIKWVSLLLWAGADPCVSGSPDPDNEDDDFNAFEWAAMAGKVEVLQLKKMVAALDPARPESARILDYCHDSEVLALFLAKGLRPDRLPDRGTSAIQSILRSMSWQFYEGSLYPFASQRPRSNIDSSRARERLKMIHMLVAHGAKWLPKDKQAIGYARRELLMMAPDYLLEFVWLMHKYGAARRSDIEELFRTPSVGRLLGKELSKANQLMSGLAESLAPAEAQAGETVRPSGPAATTTR
jgi:hypothetical protein